MDYYNVNSLLKLSRAGEAAVLIEFIKTDESGIVKRNEVLQQWFASFTDALREVCVDAVIAYESALFVYDPDITDFYSILAFAKKVTEPQFDESQSKLVKDIKIHRIPVCYELEDSLLPNDIDNVCKQKSLSLKALIDLHTSLDYQVFAVGFMPNFAYLGELPEQLQLKRLAEPRLKVPAGAVAIAEKQTAIYPSQSPGGWNIIGYTPVNLTVNSKASNNNFASGDKVRFEALDYKTYQNMCVDPRI